MPDLKAAAKLMLDAAAATAEEMKVFRSGEWHDQAESELDGFLLAAQALEAWAWQEGKGAITKRWGKSWRCCYNDGDGELVRFDADTPLGAVLAAMEGETDGND